MTDDPYYGQYVFFNGWLQLVNRFGIARQPVHDETDRIQDYLGEIILVGIHAQFQ